MILRILRKLRVRFVVGDRVQSYSIRTRRPRLAVQRSTNGLGSVITLDAFLVG
jgi:hypothetical protein